MNKLFKDNILTVNVGVVGETDNYEVRMSFGGFLDMLNDEIKKNNDVFELKCIVRQLITGFNKNDVYIHCSCPDFKYRFQFWATRNQINSGQPQNDNGKWIRNPDDSLGSGCKHILLVLNNNSWLIKVASVINNYIKYAEKHMQKAFADIIYPQIYKKQYDGNVQTSIFDRDTLAGENDRDEIDVANQYGQKRTQFQKGNEQGIRFQSNNSNAEQTSMLDDEQQ